MSTKPEIQHVVEIGGCCVSSNPTAVIKTYALGSCVALLAYDSERRVGGMIHVALPESSADSHKAMIAPCHFADTGVPLLLEKMGLSGARRQSTVFKLIGGANVIDNMTSFDIGRRNVLAIKRQLWKENLFLDAEHVGGRTCRTVALFVATGDIELLSGVQRSII